MADEYCPHCGAKMNKYVHSLNRGMLIAFDLLIRSKPPTNLKDLNLTFNQRNNFHKIRYWGIVEQYTEPDGKTNGRWDITDKGIKFSMGQIRIPKKVTSYRGEAVEFGEILIDPRDVWPEFKYKRREDYAREAISNPRVPEDDLFYQAQE